MKKFILFGALIFPMASQAILTHQDLVGKYKIINSMLELTLIISPENNIKLFERANSPEDDVIDCKSSSYRIKNNIFETTLACYHKGTKSFSADLAGVNPQNLRDGVQVPVEAFGHSLVVTVKRQ